MKDRQWIDPEQYAKDKSRYATEAKKRMEYPLFGGYFEKSKEREMVNKIDEKAKLFAEGLKEYCESKPWGCNGCIFLKDMTCNISSYPEDWKIEEDNDGEE